MAKEAGNVTINNRSYVQIQTVLPVDATTVVDELNGRQGDNMRDLYIQLLGQGNQPRALNDGSVDLVGRDSTGVIKQTNTARVINDRQGLIELDVPKQFYQATGDYQDAFLRIKDSDGKIVSTISISMTVIKNKVLISQAESTMYLKTVDDLIEQLKVKIDDAHTLADTAQKTAQSLMDLLKTYERLVEANAVALLGKDQTWSGKQTFGDVDVTGTLTAGTISANKLAGTAMTNIMSAINNVANMMQADDWNKNYTLTNGASKPGGGNDLIIRQITIGKARIIAGVGEISVPEMKPNAYFGISLPYDVGRGSAVVGSAYQDQRLYANFETDVHNNLKVFNVSTNTQEAATGVWFNFIIIPY